MSNRVSELYSSIIDQVVKETKTEIEESGEDPAVPEMSRDAWKKRLSEMNVTREPSWASDSTATSRNMRPELINSGAPLNLANLNNMPMTADPSALYGVPNVSNGSGTSTVQPSSISPSNPSIQTPKTEVSSAGVPSMTMNMNPLGSTAPSANAPQHQQGSHNGGPTLSNESQNQITNAMENHKNPNIPQTDGPQDEELNSDLDDSEDESNSNDEDEDTDQSQIMLCLYEKVHKVKTRWKYTLKDGIANVNGLDYVFAKATGESEW